MGSAGPTVRLGGSALRCSGDADRQLRRASGPAAADRRPVRLVGRAAFFAAFGTAVHLVGTYLARWPTDRFGARRVLVAATLLRGGVVLAGIPVAMALGVLQSDLRHGLRYTVEALIRG